MRIFQRGWFIIMVSVKSWPDYIFFILGHMGQENAIYGILEQKKPFKAKKVK